MQSPTKPKDDSTMKYSSINIENVSPYTATSPAGFNFSSSIATIGSLNNKILSSPVYTYTRSPMGTTSPSKLITFVHKLEPKKNFAQNEEPSDALSYSPFLVSDDTKLPLENWQKCPKDWNSENNRIIEMTQSARRQANNANEKIISSLTKQVGALFEDSSFCSLDKVFNDAAEFIAHNLKTEYQNLRNQLECSVSSIIQLEMKRLNCSMDTLIYQLESMRDLARTYEKQLAKKDSQIDQLTTEVIRLREHAEEDKEMMEKSRMTFLIQLTEAHWRRHLLFKIWTAWKRGLESSWKARAHQRLITESQQNCAKLKEDYEIKLAEFRERLRQSEAQCAEIEVSQTETKLAMKSALMRGVCALNMETMGVMQNGETQQQKQLKSSRLVPPLILSEGYHQNNNEAAICLPKTGAFDSWPRQRPFIEPSLIDYSLNRPLGQNDQYEYASDMHVSFNHPSLANYTEPNTSTSEHQKFQKRSTEEFPSFQWRNSSHPLSCSNIINSHSASSNALFRSQKVEERCPAGLNIYSSSLLNNVLVTRHDAKNTTLTGKAGLRGSVDLQRNISNRFFSSLPKSQHGVGRSKLLITTSARKRP